MFPQIFGKYVLERELASGGMARVFLATLRGAGGFEKRLVVKQIRPELASDQSFTRRFVAEAKTTVELSHANIVPVYELGAEQGTYYIAMEFCAGVSLAELLVAGAATPSEGAYIGVEICRALDYAHRKAGVVHRDVTPRNVMIDPEGSVRLIDFGIAASTASEASSGPCFGSPGHMPPEQLSSGPLTPAADVFAVAVLLIETWTGRAPFRRESFEASARAFAEPRQRLADSDPSLAVLDPLIAAALSRAPSDRPQTAEEFARPLREFLRQDDLGDIARRLGQRVNEHLAGLAQPELEPRREGVLPRPLATTGVLANAGSTLTFAARDALLQWTARIESTPPQPASSLLGAALEIESGLSAPSAPVAASSEAGTGRRRGLLFGAMLGAAAVFLLGVGARPFMTPNRLEPGAASELSTLAGGQMGTTARREPLAPSAPSVAAPSVASPAPLPAASVAALTLPSADTTPRAPQPGPATPEPRGSLSSEATPAPEARLQLTSEPAAWVEVDAVRVGRTPLSSLGVRPGHHSIRFVNQLLGERLEASVTLGARGSARVHADFTSANPQVYVR
jgi:serine/threonine protein kinase